MKKIRIKIERFASLCGVAVYRVVAMQNAAQVTPSWGNCDIHVGSEICERRIDEFARDMRWEVSIFQSVNSVA
jgi:hypothetical protein